MFSRSVTTGALLLGLAAAAFAAEPPERDPTQPFRRTTELGSSAAAPRFALTAVVISPTRRVAVVNGQACSTGDVVAGAQILAIEHDSVRLREGGADLVISLGRPQPGRPSVQGVELP